MPKPKRPARDKSVAYTVVIAALLLSLGFVFAWFYQQRAERLRSVTAYSKPLRAAAATADYSVAINFSVRTSGADIGWADEHRQILKQVVKQALATGAAANARAPGGLEALQQTLLASLNAELHTDKIQQLVITDFLVSYNSD